MDMNYYAHNPNRKQMNESWHIPRASLGGSSTLGSSNSSNKSHSNPPSVSKHSHQLQPVIHSNLNSNVRDVDKHFDGINQNNLQKHARTGKLTNKMSDQFVGSTNKRGSRSSQGSNDSNNSSDSASSGSLLLTAANLERFVAIHKNQHYNAKKQLSMESKSHQNYNANIRISQNLNEQDIQSQVITEGLERNDTFITIDPNLHFVKTKDVDTMSIASSTHFTMVNGMGGPQRKTKSNICSRGHQITVLILSMSMLFLFGILAAVYLLEMRAREMPH